MTYVIPMYQLYLQLVPEIFVCMPSIHDHAVDAKVINTSKEYILTYSPLMYIYKCIYIYILYT